MCRAQDVQWTSVLRGPECSVDSVGDMMSGALIETEARTILNQGKNQGISQNQRETALRLLKRGKQTVEEIAEDTGLSVEEVGQMAGLQTI